MLVRAEIKGFKCLHDVSVELRPFNVLIGPNNAGKSNLAEAVSLLWEMLGAPPGWSALSTVVQGRRPASMRTWDAEGPLALGWTFTQPDPGEEVTYGLAFSNV